MNRSAELAAVARENINFRGDSMVLSVRANFIVKNQGQGHAPFTVEIPNLPASSLGTFKR